MERPRYDRWLEKRQNVLSEGWWDRVLGRPPTRQGPTGPSAPTEPSQVYNHPVVNKYYDEVIDHLGLHNHLEVLDGAGNKTGDFNGNLPPEIGRALRRFVASHVLGGGQSFLRVSHHDAILVLNFLDKLRVPGETERLTDRLGISNPASFSHWMETKLPVAKDAARQIGFGQASNQYTPNRGEANSPIRDPKVRGLIEASVKVVNAVHAKVGSRNRRLTQDIINAVVEMRRSLEGMNVLDASAEPEPTQPAGGTGPAPDPDRRGRGRPGPI